MILFQSCLSVIVSKYDLNSKTPKLEKIDVPEKEVYFLGVAHIAKEEFYENMKVIIEELQEKDFIFYLESVSELDKKNISIDTFSIKKIRKLTDLDISLKYSESQNPYLQKLRKKYDLIDQPKYDFFALKNYKRVDYSYAELINFYEAKFGKIELDSCDVNTEIRSIYKCKSGNTTERKNFTDEIILDVRNRLIADSITKSNDKKIVVIYGKAHLKGIKQYLN